MPQVSYIWLRYGVFILCISWGLTIPKALQWRHNDHGGVSNHQPHGCLLNRLFRRGSKKTSKLRVTGLCVGNSPGPVTSPHKGPVTRKMFPFDDVIMVIIFNWLFLVLWYYTASLNLSFGESHFAVLSYSDATWASRPHKSTSYLLFVQQHVLASKKSPNSLTGNVKFE